MPAEMDPSTREKAIEVGGRTLADRGFRTLGGKPATWEEHGDDFRSAVNDLLDALAAEGFTLIEGAEEERIARWPDWCGLLDDRAGPHRRVVGPWSRIDTEEEQ